MTDSRLAEAKTGAKKTAETVEKVIEDATGYTVARAAVKMANEVMMHQRRKEENKLAPAKPASGPAGSNDLENAAAKDKSTSEPNQLEFQHHWWQSVAPNCKLDHPSAAPSDAKQSENSAATAVAKAGELATAKTGELAIPHDSQALIIPQKAYAPDYPVAKPN